MSAGQLVNYSVMSFAQIETRMKDKRSARHYEVQNERKQFATDAGITGEPVLLSI